MRPTFSLHGSLYIYIYNVAIYNQKNRTVVVRVFPIFYKMFYISDSRSNFIKLYSFFFFMDMASHSLCSWQCFRKKLFAVVSTKNIYIYLSEI